MRRILSAFRVLVLGGMAVPACFAPPARAAEPVDLELILAVDVSGSIDYAEAKLQREGYVAALVDAEVLEAIRSGMLQRIALMYMEWAGDQYRRTVVDWTLIHDRASAEAFAAALAKAPITTERFTSISGAIDYAVPRFAENDFEGTRRVIDISGDGPNNTGRFVQSARDDAVARGIIINGLPIMSRRENSLGFPNLQELDLYYKDCVIGGPGAFTILASGFEDFAAAIRRKLILEMAGRTPRRPSLSPASLAAGGPPDCSVGERQLIDFLRSPGDMPN